ncbi:MAG TPA: HlyD family efflux transporter periplasmic adaptor subunit [Polyangiaceae bacterium]|jgi:HlyD family secretion protein|nr:HlyD family efflux transporter periplasmic adaptor subunit [Polyangiaceae bacterium]
MIKNAPRGWWVGTGLGLVLAGACGAAGCQRAHAEPPEEIYQGTAELDERRLSFEVGGRITALHAREGDQVKAGALLATIDDALDEQARAARELEAHAAAAQATVVDKGVRPEEIAVTKAKIRAAQAAEALVKKQLERERGLLAQEATPQARVDDLEAQYQRSVADREALESLLSEQQRGARPEERAAARATADAAKANVALDDLRIERRELRAPADEVVLDRHVESGEVVAAGAPVLTVADPGRLYAYVFVPQAKLPGIDVGDRASVRADGMAEALAGHVEFIARRSEFTPRYLFSETERANLVVRVKIRILDPRSLLHAGVPVRVAIDRNTPPGERVVNAPPSVVPAPSARPSTSSRASAGSP